MTELTPRERLVVEAVADPSEPTLRQVAAQLGYAYETVNDVLKQVRVKVGTRSAYGLARWLSAERGDVVLARGEAKNASSYLKAFVRRHQGVAGWEDDVAMARALVTRLTGG